MRGGAAPGLPDDGALSGGEGEEELARLLELLEDALFEALGVGLGAPAAVGE